MQKNYKKLFKNKKIIVTGYWIKGTWLSAWLVKLGAKVAGVSNDYHQAHLIINISILEKNRL